MRLASVVVPYKAGYVVAGRSLREVENRVVQIQTLVFLAWVVTALASLVVAVLIEFLVRSR